MSPLIEERLRDAFTARAADVGAGVAPHAVRAEARRLRRHRRAGFVAGAALVTGLAVAVLAVGPSLPHRSAPALPTGPEWPGLHAQAVACGCVLAFGRTIEDGATGRSVTVRGTPASPIGEGDQIATAVRAGDDHYVVVTTTGWGISLPPATIDVVGADGTETLIGHAAWIDGTSRWVAVSRDGTRIAFLRVGQGSRPEVVVTDLAGAELASRELPADLPVSPPLFISQVLAVDSQGVWIDDGASGQGGLFWNYLSGAVTGVHGDLLDLADGLAATASGAEVTLQSEQPLQGQEPIWTERDRTWVRGAVADAVFDESGRYLLVGWASDRAELIDPGSGTVLDSITTPDLALDSLQTTGQARWGALGSSADRNDGGQGYVLTVTDGTRLHLESRPVYSSDGASPDAS